VKKFGIGLLAVVVLLVAVVLVAPSFVDWNIYKDRIVAEVQKATGRELTIDGDISLALLPAPALSVENVGLANAVGGSEPTMVTLDSLKVRIAALPLLQGRLQVDSVALVKPTILVEVLPDGRGNWDFGAGEQPGEPVDGRAVDGETAGLPGQVALNSVTVSDGTVIYRDRAAGREERIAGLNAEVAADSLRGPFAAEGEAEVRDIKTVFEFSAGRLASEGASALALMLRLPGSGAQLNFSGAISTHPDGTSLRGRVKADGDDLAALVQALGVQALRGSIAAPTLAKPFSLETDLALDAQRMVATDLIFRQEDVSIEGAVRVSPGTPLDVQINLSTQRIDLDAFLAESGSPNAADSSAAEAPPADGGATGMPSVDGGFTLPDNITGSVQAAVDTLVFRGQVIRQVLVNAEMADGEIKLSQGIALLPGGSDVSLTGALTTPGPSGQPRFAGRIEAASDNLRAVLDWLGVDIAVVPADRLRRMTLIGDVEATPDRVTVSDLDLRVDVSRATGGIAVALRERPAFGIGLAIDKLNVDAYLPRDVPAEDAGPSGVATSSSGDGQAAGPLGGMAFLDTVDANLDVRLGSLTARGVTARDLHLDVTLQRGAAVLREALVADLAGSSVRLSGAIAGLSTVPTFDGTAQVTVPDPVPVAKALGIESDVFARLGPFDLGGTLKGSARDVTFDVTLQATGGRLGLAGTAQPVTEEPSFDVALTAVHPSLAKLAGALTRDLRLQPGLGGLDLKAQVTGTAERFTVSDLSGQIGPTEISGSLGADLSGARPALSADLVTSELPLAGLMAPAAVDTSSAVSASTGRSTAKGETKSGRWSTEPIDVAALKAVDAEVKLRAQALVTDTLRLDGAVVDAGLADGVLDLRKLTGTFYDGALSVSGKILADDGLDAGLAVTAIEMNLGRLVQDLADSDRVSGPLSLNASLTAQGKSEAELIGSLAGKGDLGGMLTVKRKTEEEVGAVVLGILGDKVKEIRGVADATNVLFSAFAGAPAALKGTFTVEKGIVSTSDTKLDGRQATALTQGTIALPAWQINTRTDVFRAEDTATPYLTVELRGPLDKPNPRISGQPFQRQPQPQPQPTAPAAPEAQPPADAPPAPTAPTPIKPEDILKEGLKGLLKGLPQ